MAVPTSPLQAKAGVPVLGATVEGRDFAIEHLHDHVDRRVHVFVGFLHENFATLGHQGNLSPLTALLFLQLLNREEDGDVHHTVEVPSDTVELAERVLAKC